MRQSVLLVIICILLIMSKYVVSSGYYDYILQHNQLKKMQEQLIDDNKRYIAEIENYRSANYLFSKKNEIGFKELTPENTIILYNGFPSEREVVRGLPKSH